MKVIFLLLKILLINEEDIIQICDKLKGVNFYEIQKKLTNIENSIVMILT